MAQSLISNSSFNDKFFKPLFELFNSSKNRRQCDAIPDELWLEIGIRRCLDFYASGRDFLQHLSESLDINIGLQTFFESLHSKRRLSLLSEVLHRQQELMRSSLPDPLSEFPELDGFDIYAGDGHFIKAAVHDPRKPAKLTEKQVAKRSHSPESAEVETMKKYPTGHLYLLNLRNHCMGHLCVGDQIERKKEHEMRALKRQEIETIRQGAPKGRKVLYVWDRAGIDFPLWHKWKSHGIYMISREKDNMKLDVCGIIPWDRSLAINRGVIADESTGTSNGAAIRRVRYVDAQSGIEYSFLTNLPISVPAGLIALLYKMRWDIEKVFDEFKNKLGEKKAWATSAEAKTNQARFLCITHNLLTLFENDIAKNSGVTNADEAKRRENRQQEVYGNDGKNGRTKMGGKRHLPSVLLRFTQRSVKFIRWLNNHLDTQSPWERCLARLRLIYAM